MYPLQPYILGLVLASVLLFHAGVIYTLHGHRFFAPLRGGKAYMENQQAPRDSGESETSREEPIRRKNEQLAELFQQMTQISAPTNLSSSAPLNPPTPSLSLETPNLMEPPVNETGELLQKAMEVDLLFASNDYLAGELIKAAEMAQGIIEPSSYEWETAVHTIKAGREEGLVQGSASLNRSGMLHEGRTDTLLGSSSIVQGSGLFERDPTLEVGQEGLLSYHDNGSIASSDDFTLDIQVAKSMKGPGFLFRIELVPKPGVKFKRIVQNYFFLVDRSHSIRFQRYELTKQAVSKALAHLSPGDTFNILIFDDKISAFSPQNLPWTQANVARAREFIAQQRYGGLFATTDLYTSLGQIVPAAVGEREVNTAILLSDGDTYLSSERQRDSIGRWTQQNRGKVSLYSLASGMGNNLALLDVLCFFNHGMLHYAPTDKEIDKALLTLMQGLQRPIGKQMTLTAVRPSPDVEISLYPNNSALPNLYEHTPFVVYGSINRLQDFHLFFQGKYYERSLDIKQAVSFAQAKHGDAATLEKKVALYQAYDSYAQFLIDGKTGHLTRAKELLKPYKISIAFQ